MTNQAAQTMPELPEPQLMTHLGREGYTADQMHQYARDYAAMLAAAPSAASVSERAREIVPVGPDGGWCTRCGCGNDAANFAHLPSCNAKTPDAAARAREILICLNQGFIGCKRDNEIITKGNAYDVFVRGDIALRAIEQALTQQRGEVEDEDYHVIMSMGRLLAEIAVTLKGAEPAGTAWSYHDLPELVKSAVENAHDIASEMRAWAAVKMRERGSSRRDKMMVEEWSKRLLALPEVAFPVKDFDIPGLSITKEEIRFAIMKVVADRAFIGQDFGGTTPQPSADAVREYVTELRAQADQKMGVAGACAHDGDRARYKSAAQLLRRVADELESLLSAASGEGVDDTKRLDWIARQGGYEFDFGILNDQPGDGDWFVHGMGGSGQGATFRDAIDAAIKEEAGGQDANTDILDTLAFKTENGDAGRGSVTYIALVASGEADHQQNAAQGGGVDHG